MMGKAMPMARAQHDQMRFGFSSLAQVRNHSYLVPRVFGSNDFGNHRREGESAARSCPLCSSELCKRRHLHLDTIHQAEKSRREDAGAIASI